MRCSPYGRRRLFIGPLVMLVASCSQQPAPTAPPAPEVEIIAVKTEDIPNIIELPGRVQAVRRAEVRARVDGIVQKRLYDEGSDVAAGQPLFKIDPGQLSANLAAAQATLARAQSALTNAQQDVDRYRPLLEGQAISKQEFDTAVARLRAAEADVAQARAQVESAQLSLSYTTVDAPIAGRAGRAEVTEGALVSAAGGTLLTTIEQLDPIYVNLSQSSAHVLALRRDINAGRVTMPALNRIPVRLELEDGVMYGETGHIDFFDLAIDESTGTAALRAEFANPRRLLLPGQFVRAHIEAGSRAGGALIPQRAVEMTREGGTVLVVNAENVVEQRKVQLGELRGAEWVVLDGLGAGDKVIVNGLQKAQPGQTVRIAAPAAAPQPIAR